VLIVLVVIVAAFAPESEYGQIRKAFPDETLREFVEVEGLKEDIADKPYVTGKILVIERQDESQFTNVSTKAVYSPRISAVMTRLPSAMRATHPDEVATVVWEFRRYEKADDGMLGAQIFVTVSTLKIVDVASGTVIGEGGPFSGWKPPSASRQNKYGPPPFEEVARFLSSLPTKLREQTPATSDDYCFPCPSVSACAARWAHRDGSGHRPSTSCRRFRRAAGAIQASCSR
jgi:hypothetical protein